MAGSSATVGDTGLHGRAAGIFLTTLVSVQLNGEFSPVMTGGDEMVSSGMVGVEEHPARRIAAPKKNGRWFEHPVIVRNAETGLKLFQRAVDGARFVPNRSIYECERALEISKVDLGRTNRCELGQLALHCREACSWRAACLRRVIAA